MAKSRLLDYDYYRSLQSMSHDELLVETKRNAKIVNNSLYRLEKSGASGYSNAFQDVLESHAVARFRVNKDMSVNQLRRINKEMKQYMEADDNTPKKIAEKYKEFDRSIDYLVYKDKNIPLSEKDERKKYSENKYYYSEYYDDYDYYNDSEWWEEFGGDKRIVAYKAMSLAKELIKATGEFINGSPVEIAEVLEVAIDSNSVTDMDSLIDLAREYYTSSVDKRREIIDYIYRGKPFTSSYEDFSNSKR